MFKLLHLQYFIFKNIIEKKKSEQNASTYTVLLSFPPFHIWASMQLISINLMFYDIMPEIFHCAMEHWHTNFSRMKYES